PSQWRLAGCWHRLAPLSAPDRSLRFPFVVGIFEHIMDAVTLCNQALDHIAARASITSINPASPPNNLAAQVASRNYETQMKAGFCSAHGNAARRQKQLTLLKAAHGTSENPNGEKMRRPPHPWLYSYAYPPNCLQVRVVMPSDTRFD